MSAIDVISVLGTGISAFSFLQSFLPGQQTHGATVEIRTSNGYDPSSGEVGNTNTGGRIRNVYGYDAGNRLLGDSGGGGIGAGGKKSFKIDQGNQNQALYVDIVADDDAVCIPVIGVTQPGDGQNYGWIGDVFKGCGLDNYYGNVDVDGSGYMPRCGWIGRLDCLSGRSSMLTMHRRQPRQHWPSIFQVVSACFQCWSRQPRLLQGHRVLLPPSSSKCSSSFLVLCHLLTRSSSKSVMTPSRSKGVTRNRSRSDRTASVVISSLVNSF